MLGIDENKFTIGKEVYYPFSVELHYFRVDKKYWSICFERIKRAGFRIVSTSVPWNLHQDKNKDIDFTGYNDSRKDLIVFLELAREFGFKVILRPGPRINAQWPNGGLPKYLFNDIKMLARDAKGQEISLPDDYGVESGFLPSYLHPHFLHFLRNYFKTFVETTKNYIYPRGPVFLVEIDYETSFAGNSKPGSADYNQDVLSKYFPGFLASRYEDIKKLNMAYREKNSNFESIDPPREFNELDIKDLTKVFDWLRFRELMLKAYLTTIEEIIKSYTVEPLFFRSLYFENSDMLPATDLFSSEEDVLMGANIFPQGTYFDIAQKGRYLQGQHKFAWGASFVSGVPSTDTDFTAKTEEYPDGLRRFYLTAGLASGFKGFNHYMFVNRDHWQGSPLASDGTITSGYEVVKKFNAAILNIKLNELEPVKQVCVIGNRDYQRMRLLDGTKQFGYIEQLMGNCINGICRDLLHLKIDYDIREELDLEELKKYKLVFMPSAEFMSEKMQDTILEMLKAGINVVLCGLMPKYNERFKTCLNLSRQTRIKSSLGSDIDIAKCKTGKFTSRVFGHILTTDNKIKKLVTINKKIAGVVSSRFKGTLYFFSFDIASEGDHNKMTHFEDILESCGVSPFMYCSDLSVDMVINKGEKRVILYMVAPPPGELSSLVNTSSREVIVRIDLKKVGIASARVKITDLFADEEEVEPMKVTSESLRKGIPLEISFPDGRMFLIEKN
ncbi:MAG: hypothetical protein GY865_05290 [candidate division Zixibacteria bacterium]|nr:hypothetical protein [candidate division Zixibacteria bacterium]